MAEKKKGSADKRSGGPREPAEIEEEIEQTREELSDTVAAAAEKANVKKQAKAKASDVKSKATAKKDAVKQKSTATKEEAAANVKEVAPDSAQAGMQHTQQTAREHRVPVVVGIGVLGGFILGWLVGRR
jgi:hypothetical protein